MTQADASRPILPTAKTFLPVILAVCVICAVVVRFSPRLVVLRAWACRPDIFEQSETGRANVALWQVKLIVAYSRHGQAVVAASLLLPWADDRFILGVPVALAVAWVMTLDHQLRAGPALSGLLSDTASGMPPSWLWWQVAALWCLTQPHTTRAGRRWCSCR